MRTVDLNSHARGWLVVGYMRSNLRIYDITNQLRQTDIKFSDIYHKCNPGYLVLHLIGRPGLPEPGSSLLSPSLFL